MKNFLKRKLPSSLLRSGRRLGLYKTYTPLPGKVDLGDFDSTSPFSNNFGYERGGPVDRYYIESFLEKNSNSIRGRVLEIGDNEYTLRYGGDSITQSDILHIDQANLKATFIGDLSDGSQLPSDSFDCIILTQTLHLIFDFKCALATCSRVLKPGGVLLLTVPGISHIDHGEWKDTWLWSFTSASITRLLKETFGEGELNVATFGNVFAATAFLYGMGRSEITQNQLDYHDPHYQLIITAKAVKAL